MATTYTGTHDLSTLLAARFTSAADFGLDTIEAVFRADLAAHNAIVNEMMGDLADVTTDRQRIYGGSLSGEMVKVDEYGRAPTQKSVAGTSVGFPLKLYQYAVGWTSKWMQTQTPADMATALLGAEKAHLKAIQREIKRAIFLSANYTFVDTLVDGVSLGVKRLVNADSAAIPEGPSGESFTASSHTHYDASATLTAAAVQATIDDVVEHGFGGRVVVAINRANEAAFRALTGFVAYVDPRLVYGASTTGIPNQRLDISRLDNRAIGLFGAAEVWVRPWIPAGYLIAWDAASPQKPLAFRQRSTTSLQGLRIAADIDAFPLHARYLEAEYGIGVWNRTNGAVLEFGVDTTYTDPAIT